MDRFLICLLLLAACGRAPDISAGFGALSVDITQAPSDAACITVTVSGAARQATRLAQALGPNQTTVFNFTGLPTGAVLLSAVATQPNCTGTPTWVSDAFSLTIQSSVATNVTLVLHRNGQASVTFDFQDDVKTVSTVAGSPGLIGSADGIGGNARFDNPEGAWSDGKGNIFLTDQANCTVRQFAIATGQVTTVAGTAGLCGSLDGTGAAARFSAPRGLTGDGGGNLYVADRCAVRKIALPGYGVTTLAGSGTCATVPPGGFDSTGATATFVNLSGITTDGINVYVADDLDFTVREVTVSTGQVQTLAGSHGNAGTADGTASAARFNSPTGLAFDGANNLVVADKTVVRRLAFPSHAVVSTVAGVVGQTGSTDGIASGALFTGLLGLTEDGNGDILMADGNAIRKLYTQTLAVVTVAGNATQSGTTDGAGGSARFNQPAFLAWDNTQGPQIFVADFSNQTIRKLQ